MTIFAIKRFASRTLRSIRGRRAGTRGDTEHLLSSPENARRILAARDDARAGRGTRVMTTEELRRDLGL